MENNKIAGVPSQKEECLLTNIPDGDNDWTIGAESFTRKEVFKILWTQRAMISNDLKSHCGMELPQQALEIIENPRKPQI